MNPIKSFSILFLLLSTLVISAPQAIARALLTYSPPSQIGVWMYWLTASGARREPYTLCASGNTRWGCTAFCDESGYPCERSQTLSYPYATNPVTILIETDYLLDVVPQEMGTYYHPTALQAQAIAARSYAYWHINQGSTINNSIQFQAFIPYKFESLPPTTFPDNPDNPCASSNLNTSQRIVCGAVAPRHYLSYGTYPNDDLPVFTEFSADVWNRTVAGSQPYLIAVDDPISTGCDANNYGHGRGMSQEGASRWARGNRCSYPGQGDDPWSVRWERAEQILVHYYTGVHIRHAANNALLTPSYRWNPLQINWGTADNRPPTMYHGGMYPISVKGQNTGISDWACGYPHFSYELRYRWAKAGHGEVTGSSAASVCGTPKGDPSPTVNLTIQNIPNWGPGAYTIRFDIYVVSAYGNFWWLIPSNDRRLGV
jgi:hypothetical protein